MEKVLALLKRWEEELALSKEDHFKDDNVECRAYLEGREDELESRIAELEEAMTP